MNSSSEQLERIVAYLDGELSAEESAQVESRLASDEQFRQELQSAQRAWSALDQLPMPHVGDEFANTTMEMVVDAARQDLEAQTIALPIQKRKRNWTNGILIAVTLLLSALVVRVIAQLPNRALLADLPVIRNMELYGQLESVDFLRQLQQNLGDDPAEYALDSQQLADRLEEYELLADDTQREQWLEALADDQKKRLNGNFNDWMSSDGKHASLRAMHEEIATDKNREQLLQTMYAYQQWLGELSPGQQAELRELDVEERAIRSTESMRIATAWKAFELTEEQLNSLFDQVKSFVQKVSSEYQQQATNRSRRERARLEDLPERRQIMFKFMTVMRKSSPYRREFVETVTNALPPEIREEFRSLDPRRKQGIVFRWFQQFHSTSSEARNSRQITEQELADFFITVLTPDEKEELLALPSDEMQRRLRQLFTNPFPGSEGPIDFRGGRPRGPFPEGPGPEGRGPRDRQGWPEGPPPFGERGGPPRLEDGPRGPRDFDRPPGRRSRDGEDRDGPQRRRREGERRPDRPEREGPQRDEPQREE